MYQLHFVRQFVPCESDDIYVNETKADETLSEVMKYVRKGWPKSKNELSIAAQLYWNIRFDLDVEDSLLYSKNRFVVPLKLRQQILSLLHASHQGTVKCKSLTKQCVYWQGVLSEIELYVNNHNPTWCKLVVNL